VSRNKAVWGRPWLQAEEVWARIDWPHQRPLLVACSGGGDSLALLDLLDGGPWPLQVAYLDHGSGTNPVEVVDFCQRRGLKLWRRQLRVSAWAARYRMSWEAAARHLRYSWLLSLARRQDAMLVTGHSADDQAETVLLRLVQGTTLVGLAGIQGHGDRFCRPLLAFRRVELRRYLQAKGIAWNEDPMNQELRFLRVAVRHKLLPVLESLNAGVIAHLGQIAQDAVDLRPLLQSELPLAEMSRLQFEEWLHSRWRHLQPELGARWERAHGLRVFQSIHQGSRGRWELPGKIWAEWDGRKLWMGRTWSSLPALKVSQHQAQVSDVNHCVVLDAQSMKEWQWRTRKPGDQWLGRSLKKCLYQWAMPRGLRDRWPLLVRPPHEVIWVPGWKVCGQTLSGERGLAFELQERSALALVEAAARHEPA